MERETQTMTSSPPPPPTMESLVLQLHDISAVNFSSTTASSSSPIHIDLRHVISSPSLLRQISQTLIPETLTSFDLLCPVPSTAATCLATSLNAPMVIPRAALTFDGVFTAGQTCLVVDTVVSGGDSVIQAAAMLRAAGLKVFGTFGLREIRPCDLLRSKPFGCCLMPLGQITLDCILITV